MKRRIFFAILLVAAAWVAGQFVTNRQQSAVEGAGRDEMRETFELSPGARVEVRGINGPVSVETSDTTTAEVHVVRTSDSRSALEHRRVVVERTSSGLTVRGHGGGRGLWRRLFGGGSVRQEVTLRVPRRINLEVSGVNGKVAAGEVEGSAQVSGVNGQVELAQRGGRVEVSGINGQVTLTLSHLGHHGVGMSGVNGNVEFRFAQSVNADIEVTGQNGGVTLNVPNVTAQERPNRSRLNARLGAGGPTLRVSGVNGHVRFQSTAPAN